MIETLFIIIIIVFFGFSSSYAYTQAYYNIKRVQFIQDKDVKKIEDLSDVAEDKDVLVEGTSQPIDDELLISPVTETECLAYEYKKMKRKQRNDRKTMENCRT